MPKTAFRVVLGFLLAAVAPGVSAAEQLTAVDPSRVRVGGEIGRRIDITIRKNLLSIDMEDDFLRPFREKKRWPFSYVGLGKQIDALVRLAVHTNDKKVIELKNHVVSETIKTQLPDGYIGIFGGGRLRVWWDVHEMSYVIFGLVRDYKHFGNRAALEAAKKTAELKDDSGRPEGHFALQMHSGNVMHVMFKDIDIQELP